MALAQKLKDAVLQSAIQGKLTTQKDTDSSACELIENIKLTKAYWLSSKKISKDSSTKIQPYDYNVEDLIEVPKSWQWVKLGELCEKIGAGSTPDGGSKVYTQSGIKFLREQNIYNEGLRLDGVVYISDQTNHLMPGSQVQAKDILVNITGASIGRNALVPDDFDIANVNQHVLIIRLIDKRLRQYIHLCLCTPLVFNQMMANQKGDKPGLSATRVSNFLIPIPPLEEQQRIVAQVDKLMAQIDEYEQIEKQLIALKAQFPLNMRDAIFKQLCREN